MSQNVWPMKRQEKGLYAPWTSRNNSFIYSPIQMFCYCFLYPRTMLMSCGAEIWASLEWETQPSERHNLKWVILWTLHRHQHLPLQLWVLFEKVHGYSSTVFVSSKGLFLLDNMQGSVWRHVEQRWWSSLKLLSHTLTVLTCGAEMMKQFKAALSNINS